MVGTCYIERGELYPLISSFFASVTSLPRCPGTPQQQPNPHRFTYKTNKHQYLLESSCHHNHKKIIIPFRLLLKYATHVPLTPSLINVLSFDKFVSIVLIWL